MKTDKELLELAAKAAGVPKKELSNRHDCWEDYPILIGTAWNPLEDDGAALRLAVRLKITPHIDDSLTDAESHIGYATEAHLHDPYAATRRAIVRAAAYIGEKL